MSLFDEKERKQFIKLIKEKGGEIGKTYIDKRVFPLKARLQQLREEYKVTKDEERKGKIKSEAEQIKAELSIYE